MKMCISKTLILLLTSFFPTLTTAESPHVRVEANTSFWWTIHEQVENGLLQAGSKEHAADQASGFNFKQGRVSFVFISPDRRIEALLKIRLEERADIIDFWGAYHVTPWLRVSIGQMKIPSTGEVLTQDHLLDFISRTTFGQNLGDFSLSRTPYISSIMAVKSYNRDLGIALKGTLPEKKNPLLNYFFMVSNGIGANKYIGGKESSEFIYTNKIGDFYYGLRVEAMIHPWVTIGVHGSLNKHDNIAIDARGPVYDLDRKVWTTDVAAHLPWNQKVYAFYGDGNMDDFVEAQHYRFNYDGWGLWTLLTLFDKRVEFGLRYDRFMTEFNKDGNETTQKNVTFGLNFRPEEYLRFQLNYIDKKTENDFEPDFDDNILFINTQFFFSTWLVQ